jgi:RimJ/RimL family protein N-acetyltransferase
MTTASPVEVESIVSPARRRALDSKPTFVSRRFEFRDFIPGDIQKMAGVAREHARVDATAELYRPTEAEDARRWLGQPSAPTYATAQHWAICARANGCVIGYCGLNNLDLRRRQAKLRFWIGCGIEAHDNSNFDNATECIRAVLDYAFNELTLLRVYALQLTRQSRSGQILAGIDMTVDGYLRKRVHSRGVFEDIACWSITTDAWAPRSDSGASPDSRVR